MPDKRVVVVAGSGRSGTSTIAGVLKSVGLRIPPPEVPGNRTNPRGFFEPQWAVELQTGLLRKAAVALTDARPAGFDATAAVAAREPVRAEVGAWVARAPRGRRPSCWSRTRATAGSSRCGGRPRRTPAPASRS